MYIYIYIYILYSINDSDYVIIELLIGLAAGLGVGAVSEIIKRSFTGM